MSDYMAPAPFPDAPKRRSTGTSDALQYYWSASAGERSGSFSSSLGISPIQSSPRAILDSPYTLSPNPPLHQTRSNVSLQELVGQEAGQERRREGGTNAISPMLPSAILQREANAFAESIPRDPDLASSTGPSNRRIHLLSYSSDRLSAMSSDPSAPSSAQNDTPPSPTSSHSADSEYSLVENETPTTAAPPPAPDVASARVGRVNPAHRRGLVDTDGQLGVLLDPSFEEWAHQRSWESSSTPVSPPIVSPHESWQQTPRQSVPTERPFASPSEWSAKSSASHDSDRTPRNSTFPSGPNTSRPSSSSSKPAHGGGLLFIAPPDVSRRSLDNLQRDIVGLGLDARGPRGQRVGLSINNSTPALSLTLDESDTPHSAPAHKTSFDDIDITRTRPTSFNPHSTTPLGTPTRPTRLGTPSRERQLDPRPPNGSSPVNFRRSPEPPPKSELRRPSPTPPLPPKATVASPEEYKSDKNGPPLPTIINTPHTPDHPQRSTTVPIAPSARSTGSPRSRSIPPPELTTSSTIQDLQRMLGGAIDEIGLVDSRDVPPPMVGEPSKEKPQQVLQSLPPRSTSTAANDGAQAPIAPFASSTHHRGSGSHGSGALASAGHALMGGTIAAAATTKGNVSRHVRKASSILSIRSSNYSLHSPTGANFNGITLPQTLPPAVLYGNIKALKTSGERARAYSRSIVELSRADSGLRELCANIQYRSGPLSRSRQGVGMGIPPSLGAALTAPPGMRNVSAGSEFPMRPDAYSAREISVRNLEPADEPTALPPNLPFPNLQLQTAAVKASGSMQSIASHASSRRPGFLSAFGRLKKDKENTTLGPPTGALTNLNPTASSSKRDLRPHASPGSRHSSEEAQTPTQTPAHTPTPSHSQIRTPSHTSNHSQSLPPSQNHSQPQSQNHSQPQSQSHTPISDFRTTQPGLAGPRGPRRPSEGPGLRSSIDTPPRAMSTPPRSSLDSSKNSTRTGPAGPRPLPSNGTSASASPSPLAKKLPDANEDRIRQFSDLIPSAERAVARAYLQRYGEMNYAVTAYIEDEKQGALMRA